MKKYLVGLLFLFFSTAWGMESTEAKSTVLRNYTPLKENGCFAIIELSLPDIPKATVYDDDSFASLALMVRLMESDYSDKDMVTKRVDIILPVLAEKVHADGYLESVKKEAKNLVAMWSDHSISSADKWLNLKNFVFNSRDAFRFLTHKIMLDKHEWAYLRIEDMGFVAKENISPPSMEISLKEPININSNSDASANVLSRTVNIEKFVEVTSDPLAKVALLHAHRYFAKDGREITYDSEEFRLVFTAFKAIEKAMPGFSRLNQGYSTFWGTSTIALLPASTVDDLMLNKNNFADFFRHYRKNYLGINTFAVNESQRLQEIKDINEAIKSINESKKNDVNYVNVDYYTEESETTEETRKKIEQTNEEIKQLNAAWKKPALFSLLNFVYTFAWEKNQYGPGFLRFRYFVIEVKLNPNDNEFTAQVTIKAQMGDRVDSLFFSLLFPKLEVPLEELVRTL